MVREFRLINEKGQEYSLMDIENYCLLTDPSGLGYEYSTEYEQLGNSFINTIRTLEQGRIDGTVNFINYDNFKSFVDYIENSEELRIKYKIPFEDKTKEYLRDVEIQQLGKTQKQTNGIISEPITFNCISLWYEENTTIYEMQPQSGEIRWDFTWDSKFADYDITGLSCINEGHVEAPIEVVIDGRVVNPTIELYVEGELYQSVAFNVAIEQFEKLLYGTKENEFYVEKQKTDGTVESLFNLDVLDFYNDNVIRLPRNKSCELRLRSEDGISRAEVTIFPQYKAV